MGKLPEQDVGATEEDGVGGPGGGGAKGLGEERLADADRSDEENVFLALEEL
jgi:hypothetical protein